jgi:hypothetical protein
MRKSYKIYWQNPLWQVSVPQHCDEVSQRRPWP